jgi:hypothetical protein
MMRHKRDLPGGGIVAIEVAPHGGRHRGRLVIERRSDPHRRDGHPPPIVVEATGDDAAAVYDQLYAIAYDNVAIARAIMDWEERNR